MLGRRMKMALEEEQEEGEGGTSRRRATRTPDLEDLFLDSSGNEQSP